MMEAPHSSIQKLIRLTSQTIQYNLNGINDDFRIALMRNAGFMSYNSCYSLKRVLKTKTI